MPSHVEANPVDCSMRAAFYARVSSERQAQAQTIASQVDALRHRIAQDGYRVDPELCFVDDGYSGASLIRPALERLRDLAAAGSFDRLYVHCPDRLARKYAYQVLLIDELRRCGIEVIFLNHPPGHSPEEHLLLQVQGMVAEYERAKIMERSRRGKLHAARQGRVNSIGKAPYGYRYVRTDEAGGQARYEISLEQARIVGQVFQWVGRDRLALQEVCRRLQQQGIPTATGKPLWSRTSVWQILNNPAYKGQAAYGRTCLGPRRPRLRPLRGKPEQPRHAVSVYHVPRDQWIPIEVPAIVPEDLFDLVQDQLDYNRRHMRQSRRGARYLLQGLVVCQECGYAYYGRTAIRHRQSDKPWTCEYYRCLGSDRFRFGGHRTCFSRSVRTDKLDQAVWNDVCSLLKEPDRIIREHERRLTRSSQSVPIDRLRFLSQKTERGMNRLIDAYQDGLIDRAQFEPRLRQAKDRFAQVNQQLNELLQEQSHQQDLRLVIGHVEAFASLVQKGLEDADWAAKRQIIQTLVRTIEIGPETVKIAYRVDCPPFVQTPNRGVWQHCHSRVCVHLWFRQRQSHCGMKAVRGYSEKKPVFSLTWGPSSAHTGFLRYPL
jgi:site-specific DNA recombinase